jgi:glycosyltransferase involved in cell wall biosynthesis
MNPTAPAPPRKRSSCSVVFIDANPFSCRRFTGLARYTARLALALAARVPVRFWSGSEEILPPRGLNWSRDQDLVRWARQLWRGRRIPLGEPPPDSIGLYCATRPEQRYFPFEVSVLHDFSPLILPETHLESTRTDFQRFFAKTLILSDLALADSRSTQSDAAWLSPFEPDRILVAYPGPSLCVGTHGHRGPVARSERIGLVVSTLEPRKNTDFLLGWFRETTVLPEGSELWWVGPLGWLMSRRKLKQLAQVPKGRKVRFLGVVSDATLCYLYQRVGWSIYPSLYEGFGFPVLDALRHGTPVLASGNSALCEFDSPGLHFFDPCDPATVDQAWRTWQAAGSVLVPREPLDQRYNWDRVVTTLLDAHAAQADVVPSSTATRAA